MLRRVLGSVILFATLAAAAWFLYAHKMASFEAAAAAAAAMPEPAEVVEAAPVTTRAYVPTSTAIGTVRALRSVTLRNELPGTVRAVHLETGALVAAGDLLVQLDVAVETAQLEAAKAEARLAESMLGRMQRALDQQGASEADVDRARAERDMAEAAVMRLEAIIAQKRIVAPFAARVGLVDLHVGQYLEPGTRITSLQGVADSVHVDFAVTQEVAAHLTIGGSVTIGLDAGQAPATATIRALDAEVDATTRNAVVRAELGGLDPLPRPGSSVRVTVPLGSARDVLVVPVTALRRGPAGNSVFVLTADPTGALRSHARRVESGTVLGDVVIVHSGVVAGEQVAALGSFKLREGALVHVAATAPAGGAGATSTAAEVGR